VVLGAVLVGVWVLVLGVVGVFGVAMLVVVVLGTFGAFVMSLAVRVGVRVLMLGVVRILGVAMLVVGVLRSVLTHQGFSSICGSWEGGTHVATRVTVYACAQIRVNHRPTPTLTYQAPKR